MSLQFRATFRITSHNSAFHKYKQRFNEICNSLKPVSLISQIFPSLKCSMFSHDIPRHSLCGVRSTVVVSGRTCPLGNSHTR